MSDTNVPLPFEAYTGHEPYLFVSYAHADAHDVYLELEWLNSQGYRIWYDEGIDPGNEWPEEVAKALSLCAQFIVFLTYNACNSQNVRNEINFALKHHIPSIVIHLEKITLPIGLDLQIGSSQAILKYRMKDENYRRKILKSLPENLRITQKESQSNVFPDVIQNQKDQIKLQPDTLSLIHTEHTEELEYTEIYPPNVIETNDNESDHKQRNNLETQSFLTFPVLKIDLSNFEKNKIAISPQKTKKIIVDFSWKDEVHVFTDTLKADNSESINLENKEYPLQNITINLSKIDIDNEFITEEYRPLCFIDLSNYLIVKEPCFMEYMPSFFVDLSHWTDANYINVEMEKSFWYRIFSKLVSIHKKNELNKTIIIDLSYMN